MKILGVYLEFCFVRSVRKSGICVDFRLDGKQRNFNAFDFDLYTLKLKANLFVFFAFLYFHTL